MSKYVIDETTLVAMANEVRILADSVDKLTTDEMTFYTKDANEEIDTQEDLIQQIEEALRGKVAPGGGDDTGLARSIINKTITSYIDNEIVTVGGYSFVDCNAMTSVNVPSATSLGNYAFSSCDTLASVNIPLVTSIGQYCFNACASLESITGEAVASVGAYGFTGCSALSSINFPKLKSIGQYAFQSCALITEFDGPAVTSIATYAFTGCSKLASVNFPLTTSVAAYAFNGTAALKHLSLPALKSMTANCFRGSRFESCDLPLAENLSNSGFRSQAYLKSITLPKVESASTDAMRGCTGLTYVDLPKCTQFAASIFNGCTNLETLIMRASKVCSMANANALTDTKIANGEGYIYVPSTLVNSYKTATNWSTYSAQIRAIEDYPEITGGQ